MDKQVLKTDEISLKELIQKMSEILGYLKTQWWKLTLLGLLGGMAGFLYTKFTKPVYVAKLTFALSEGGDKLGGIGSIASQFGVDLMGNSSAGAFSGENLLELMKSRLLVEKTLLTAVDSSGKSKLLINQYIDFYKPKKSEPRKSDEPLPVYFTGKENKEGFSIEQDSFLAKISKDIVKKIYRLLR